MLSFCYSASVIGFSGLVVEVECDVGRGLPGLIIVGLGAKTIDESRERVKSAIKNSNLQLPNQKITINLAPANVPKDGSGFDLAMAISMLVSSKQVAKDAIASSAFIAELALDGRLRPVPGIITMLKALKKKGIMQVFIASENAAEASLVSDLEIMAPKNLVKLYRHLVGEEPLIAVPRKNLRRQTASIKETDIDFGQVVGQDQAKRALQIAAAGNHNILLSGPPGAGKSMMAKALKGILPPVTDGEVVEITEVHSLLGKEFDIQADRPFRAPHYHTASTVAMIGGGHQLRPGEISLSHHGILFLDELPEFARSAIEALRQPLEDKVVSISRAARSATFPANFMLVATQNPCPCGYAGDASRECACSAQQIVQYQRKLSGPLLDRIDLQVHVQRVETDKLLDKTEAARNSGTMRMEVVAARTKQQQRQAVTNSLLSNRQIKELNLRSEARELLESASEKFSLSARAFMRSLKVAQTIADLEGSEIITQQHIAEALQFRLS